MNLFEKSKVSMKGILLTIFYVLNKKTDDDVLILHLVEGNKVPTSKL